MHLVVSSKRSRAPWLCWRSRAGRAGGPEDPVVGRAEAPPRLGALLAFAGGRRLRGDEIRLHRLVLAEEGLLVDHQVFDDGKTAQRLNADALAQLLDQPLAGQAVPPVDERGVRAADAVGAGAAEGQRAVLVPLDAVHQVEDAVGGFGLDLVLGPVGLGGALPVEPSDPQFDLHALSVSRQYFRSWGWKRVMLTDLYFSCIWPPGVRQ